MADTSNLIYAPISNGKSTYEASNVDKNTGKIKSDEPSDTAGGKLDKDAFLQLLVAQMKYQDPLEPTDNTEYVSQLANFSSLEQMQNMSNSMSNMSLAADMQRAANMVGEYATIQDNGVTITTGKVDTVEFKDGKTYVSINGKSYELSKVAEQIDKQYLAASAIASQFNENLKKLPDLEAFTDTYEPIVASLRQVYENLDTYQRSFISDDDLHTLEVYEKRLAEIKEQIAKELEEASENEDNSGSEGTEAVDGVE